MQFELPDKEEMCFYHDFDGSEKYIIEFRVIRGGNNDVDVKVTSPNGKVILYEKKQHMGKHEIEVSHGKYSFCFGNTFSTVTHKQVYFSIHPKRLETLEEEAGNPAPKAHTMIESLTENIHIGMTTVEAMQTSFRLREVEGRALSEELNERINIFSLIVLMAVIITGFGQVTMLKTFFSDKKVIGQKYSNLPPARA